VDKESNAMQAQSTAKEIAEVMCLEYIQNAPLIAGFLSGAWFWPRDVGLAALCIVVGSVLSALVIIPTEARIFEGHQETWQAVAGNVVAFCVLTVVFIAYLYARWSGWWTDVGAGVIAGAVLGTVQDLVVKEPIGLLRILLLGISCSVSLLIVRLAVQVWPPGVGFAIVTAWFTLVMGAYKLWRKRNPIESD
jgi:hypothetical protein